MYIDNSQFSDREKQVAGLLLQGKSNKQIAMTLGVSASTVEYHLKNVYKKLQVNSRTEAVLRLGKSIGNNTSDELGKSIVEISGEPADNGGKSISTWRISMKNLSYIVIGSLLTAALVIVFVLFNMPARNEVVPNTPPSEVPGTIIAPTIVSPSLLTEQPLASWQEITLTNNLDSATASLTLKWFYIDSTRVSLQFLVSGFIVPDGYLPNQIIQNISLHTKDGTSIISSFDNMRGSESNANILAHTFNEVFLFAINSNDLAISQEEFYIFEITVGGVPVFDEEGNATDELLPSTTFHFEANPSYVGSLTFVTEKAANIGDKVVTLKGAEVNPTTSTITLCVYSPDKQQWLPSVSLLYKGAIFAPSGRALTNTKTELTEELCYRLDYPIQFDITDDPKQTIAIWVDKLTKDQPERLPNEIISSAFQKLSTQGIEFSYVLGDHGASIEITKKPTELPEIEALKIIQDALTEEALTSGVLIFDLK